MDDEEKIGLLVDAYRAEAGKAEERLSTLKKELIMAFLQGKPFEPR